MSDEGDSSKYLACESRLVFELLIMTAGMMGAYTYNLRGGVFSNAQTANVVLMGIAFGKNNIIKGLYYLIPLSSYILGAIISEVLPVPVKKIKLFRWDTILIALEMVVLFLIGLIPFSVSNHLVQVVISFLCAMQQNTFRQAESIPMATTLCTNHVRQVAVWGIKYVQNKNYYSLVRGARHFAMIGFFFLGGLLETMICNVADERSIWLAMIPLGVNLFTLIKADLVEEKHCLDKIPLGH